MVPILMIYEKQSATRNLQGTHSTQATYVIDQSKHIFCDLAVSLYDSTCNHILFTHPIGYIQNISSVHISFYLCGNS